MTEGYAGRVSLIVRPALPHDVPALADLAARTFPLACPPELDAQAVESFIRTKLDVAAFHRYLTESDHTVLTGTSADGIVVAYALLVDGAAMDPGCADQLLGPRPVGISKFYLDPHHHGSGAATTLLQAVLVNAGRAGADSVWLATNVGNARARAFYAKNGFVPRGHRVFEVGGVLNDDVVLERML